MFKEKSTQTIRPQCMFTENSFPFFKSVSRWLDSGNIYTTGTF